MKDSIRISPENSLALTEGQEGELVSTVRPCSGSSISGQVSPCNTKAHFKAQSLTLQCMCRREKNRNLSPCSINVSPTAILQGLTEKAPSASLQLHRFKASMGQGFTPSEGIQWYIYKSYQYAASVSSETQISSHSFLMKLESTNLTQPRNILINLNQGNLIGNYTEKTWHFQCNTHI